MKIFDETKTIELKEEECDLTSGYLEEVEIEVNIPEQLEQKEEGYFETVTEYSNGGKDVRWVMSKPSIPYIAEHKENMLVKIYHKYDEEFYKKLKIKTLEDNIKILENELNSSDYKIIKSYEYNLLGKELPYNINELHSQRELIRNKINELKKELVWKL